MALEWPQLVINSNRMNEPAAGGQPASLEEHLTNSIRRAKERIYTNAISSYGNTASNYSHLTDFSLSQQPNNSFEPRGRANSQRQPPSNVIHREQRNILASAMRTLQEKIMQLQRQNQELRNTRQEAQTDEHRRGDQREEGELAKLTARLRDREDEVRRLTSQNRDLSSTNAELAEKVSELEHEIDRMVSRQLDFPSSRSEDGREQEQANTEAIREQELKIGQQEQLIQQLQLDIGLKTQQIEQLGRKLEQEKKLNMRWIKLHDAQLAEADHKENNSLDSNAPQPAKPTTTHPRKQEGDLARKNREMYDSLQRSKAKIAELGRECKQYEERFTEMKLIALEIVESVNKMLPHQGSHIKYLTTKILKLENSHLESLRSFSNHSRKSRIDRGNTSKSRKRELKMEDLTSSAKKSKEGSHSKSHKKRHPPDEHVTRSEKKQAREEEQVEEVEREVQALMKRYRNLVMRSEKDKGNEELTLRIEETSREYNEKKLKCEELRKQLRRP